MYIYLSEKRLFVGAVEQKTHFNHIPLINDNTDDRKMTFLCKLAMETWLPVTR